MLLQYGDFVKSKISKVEIFFFLQTTGFEQIAIFAARMSGTQQTFGICEAGQKSMALRL